MQAGVLEPYRCTIYRPDETSWNGTNAVNWSLSEGRIGKMSVTGNFIADTVNIGTEILTASYTKSGVTYKDTTTITVVGGQANNVHDYGSMLDQDGNEYQTILIGDQEWMAENLEVTHYRNGDVIDHVTDDATWAEYQSGAYCAYENDENNVATYGYLYNWHAVNDSRNIAPEGWHVPTDDEWLTLVDYLGDSGNAGGKLKETGIVHWESPNTGATNESGFSALPGGARNYQGIFESIGTGALFWTASEYSSSFAWLRYLYNYGAGITRSGNDQNIGFSIRLVRD